MRVIASQFQIIEDEARVSVELAQCGGDAVGVGADESDGEAPELGGVLGAVAGTDAASVFVEGGVEDVVSGFDTPVSPIESEEALRAGGVGGMAGDAVGELDAAFIGGFVDDGAFDEEGLFDMWEGEVVVEAGGGPDGARFEAPVLECERFAEVGFGAVLENAFEVGEHGGVVGLDAEHEVGAPAIEVLGEGALCEQGIGGDRGGGEVELEGVEYGHDGAEFVGAFGLIAGAHRQAAYVFLGEGDLAGMADGAQDVGVDGAVFVNGDGVAQRLAVNGERLVDGAMHGVQSLQGAVELDGVDAGEHVADNELAGHVVVAMTVSAAESFAGALGEVASPLGHRLVGARAAQRGGGGDGQHRGQGVTSALAAAGVVDIGEALGQGAHVVGGEHHLRASMSVEGVEHGLGEPGSRVWAQGTEEDELRGRDDIGVTAAHAPVTAGEADTLPVRGAIHRAVEALRVDEGLQKQQPMAEARWPKGELVLPP